MFTLFDQALISTLSKKLVPSVAPDELDLFDELFADYMQNPQPPTLTRASRDDALGSGLGLIMTTVTPAAAAIANRAVNFIATMLQTTQNASTDCARDLPNALERRHAFRRAVGGSNPVDAIAPSYF